jgi:hypothetical protein
VGFGVRSGIKRLLTAGRSCNKDRVLFCEVVATSLYIVYMNFVFPIN